MLITGIIPLKDKTYRVAVYKDILYVSRSSYRPGARHLSSAWGCYYCCPASLLAVPLVSGLNQGQSGLVKHSTNPDFIFTIHVISICDGFGWSSQPERITQPMLSWKNIAHNMSGFQSLLFSIGLLWNLQVAP